jgi:hypothetical protein
VVADLEQRLPVLFGYPAADREVVAVVDRRLGAERAAVFEPLSACLGAVEPARVGQLELAEREIGAVAALTVVGGQRRGQPLLPAEKETPDLVGAEPVAERLQRVRVGAGSKTVSGGFVRRGSNPSPSASPSRIASRRLERRPKAKPHAVRRVPRGAVSCRSGSLSARPHRVARVRVPGRRPHVARGAPSRSPPASAR